MIRKDTLDFVKECVRIFDAGKSKDKPELVGVQFVERVPDSAHTTLMFSTGSLFLEHSLPIKASVPSGFAQYRVPMCTAGAWKVADTGNIVNETGSLYPAPQAPLLSLRATASSLNAKAAPAMSLKMLSNMLDAKYVYMEGRDIFCVKSDVDKAAWMSSAADIPKALVTPSSMTRAFARLFAEKTDDTLVSFVGINSQFVAMQLTSEKLHIQVSHILCTPGEQEIDIRFAVGKTNLRLVRNGKEFNLTKEEKMDVSQISQLFGSHATNPADPVVESITPASTPTPEKPVEQVPVDTTTATTPETVKESVSETVSETVPEAVPEQPATTAAEQPAETFPPEPVKEPTTAELLEELIISIDGIKAQATAALKPCKEACKRVKKLEKNPPKTGLEERIKELEAELAQVKGANAKLKKALDAATAW